MKHLALVALGLGWTNFAAADVIVFNGKITQSTQDFTGPAQNNLSLNNIQDLQAYTATLNFTGSITSPGTYDLTGSSFTFNVPSALATESAFGSISLTITAGGGFDQFSLLACLTTGSGCVFGNQLTANFEIPVGSLNSQNVAATGLDQPHPLDLLEDDGITDIHGSIDSYSYSGGRTSDVPEPSSIVLLAGTFVGLGVCLGTTKSLNNRRRQCLKVF